MAHAHASGVSRVRDSSTWWSVAIVIAIHVLLFFWLLSLRWSMPVRNAIADMVLVELNTTPESPLGNKKQAIAAPNVTPSPTSGRAHAGTAAPRREMTHKDLENRVTTSEGTAAPGTAIVSLAPSNPIDGSVTGMGDSHGASAAPAGGDGARARGRFHAPEVTRRFRPDYPLDAFQARRQGSVDVMVTIGTDASVKEAHVFQSSGDASLDRAAVEAVRHYVFRAARRGEEIVEAQALVTIDWVILGSGASSAQSRPH